MTATDQPNHGASLVGGRLSQTIFRLALPAVGTSLFQLLFLLVDTFWVGRLLGPVALAAVTTGGFAVWMLNALGQMVEVGLTAVSARRHGEGAYGLAAVIAGTTLTLALAMGVLAATAGMLMVPAFFALAGTPAEVTDLGRVYLAAYLAGSPFLFGFFAVEAAFRASGDTRTPFLLVAASGVLVVLLEPVLILGAGPLPPLGIAGAAVAAILTRGAALTAGLVILARRRMVRLSVFDWKSGALAFWIGLPTAATGVFFSLVYVGLTRITAPFGVAALAALGIGHKLEGLSYMVATGFGLASAAIVGQNMGAGRADRARTAGWATTGYASAVGAVVALAFVIAPELLVGIFTDDPAVVATGAAYLRALALAQVSMGLEIVLQSALGGAGFTVQPMLWTALITAARIPLAAWLSGAFGVTGIWWVIGLTAVVRGLAMAALWRGERWERVSV